MTFISVLCFLGLFFIISCIIIGLLWIKCNYENKKLLSYSEKGIKLINHLKQLYYENKYIIDAYNTNNLNKLTEDEFENLRTLTIKWVTLSQLIDDTTNKIKKLSYKAQSTFNTMNYMIKFISFNKLSLININSED